MKFLKTMILFKQFKSYSKNNLSKYAKTEKNILSVINHPFIVRLHCAFQSASRLFMVMDYCPGGDLGRMIQKEKRLGEEQAKIYLAEVLLALEELHKNNIIYRDLKPDNVVLDVEGHALLTDFGLSKEGMHSDEYARSFCGSIAYLAPEILKHSGHNRTVDWYLLGVLLYEMLIGIPPYFHNEKDRLFENIKRGPLFIPHNMPKIALDLIVKLLNRDPKKRLGAGPRDAEEIKEHPFFVGIIWEDVLKRKLSPPKPAIRPLPKEGTPLNIFHEPYSGTGEERIQNWTFISSDFSQQ